MTKKSSTKTSLNRRATSSVESIAKLMQTIAAQAQEIREGAEQQAATSAILRMIASSPTDIQPVLDRWQNMPLDFVAQTMRLSGGSKGWPYARCTFWLDSYGG